MALLEIAQRSIRHYRLVPPGTVVLIGVSGGADSLALMHVLKHLAGALDFRLHVATLDHQLRGQAGADDAKFVVEMAKLWNIPATMGQTDVPKLAQEQRIGIETTARIARYQFLAQTAREIGASHIAVAHHADDQVETVLMHLIRGSGIQGLSGMAWSAPVPNHPDLTLIRPFLGITRAQIDAYCTENDLKPRQDATNSDTSLLRNRLRVETLPHLQQLNPKVARSLTQLADVAAAEGDYIHHQLIEMIQGHVQTGNERTSISRRLFRELHPALQRRFIYWAAHQLGSTETDHEHILAAVRLGIEGKTGAISLLAGGLRLRVDYEILNIERIDAPPPTFNIPLLKTPDETAVNIPGITHIPQANWHLETRLTPIVGNRLAISEGSQATLRTRRTSDDFAPLGLHGHKQKIKDWMIDHKVPKAIREQIPLLLINGQIAAVLVNHEWIIGEAFAVHSDTTRIVYFAIHHDDC
jgi:tRNA(Ile)-lysidine synthase